ncbi:hypothetical protein PV749_24935 [Streptomyces sp. ID03-2B]|uniref:hypothetical protein n=1 Tax=Streptomyces TaxID=1883 RepID=UPI001876F399|nr:MULTISPECIES: hypothetical protein [Streptomyces]MDX2669765.1 hypothetical protein [Streptomyces sp. NRRL_ISP-5395]MDX3594368.1 hypothetical protein [Streptomyces sp. ID03-2B]QXQ98598.1 hypothetical protein KV381_21290 [Streptomyces sp. WY228]GHF69288.1 hypothetical protein GCM10010504_42130 [Streptomyces griseus]
MKRTRLWKSFVPVVVNLLLGIPAVVPVFLIWYVLSNGPLAELGWTQREPTENDGMWLWLVIVVPVVACFGGLWTLLNLWMRRRLIAAASPYPYWSLAVTLTLAPFLLGAAFG